MIASESGVLAAACKFSKDDKKLKGVRGFKNAYREELIKKRAACEDVDIRELQPQKRGRPLLLVTI